MKNKQVNIITSIVLAIASLIGFFYARATDTTSTIGLTPNTYPKILCISMFVCSLILVVKSIVTTDIAERTIQRVNWKSMLPILLVLTVYVFTLKFSHFIISTTIFLFVEMILFGERRWKTLVPVSLIIPTALFYLFRGFQIFLPS